MWTTRSVNISACSILLPNSTLFPKHAQLFPHNKAPWWVFLGPLAWWHFRDRSSLQCFSIILSLRKIRKLYSTICLFFFFKVPKTKKYQVTGMKRSILFVTLFLFGEQAQLSTNTLITFYWILEGNCVWPRRDAGNLAEPSGEPNGHSRSFRATFLGSEFKQH